MRSYSEREIFTKKEVLLMRGAATFVDALMPEDEMGKLVELRCHELARVIGTIMQLSWVDGHYGAVEHSWLLLPPGVRGFSRGILDVYAVARLPMVQLIDVNSIGPNQRQSYRDGPTRRDIDEPLVAHLIKQLRDGCKRAGIKLRE